MADTRTSSGWWPHTSTRIGLWAALASAAIGLLLATFQVQAWKMPKALALALIISLTALFAVAMSAILYELLRHLRAVMARRATSASWVSSEHPGLLDFEADGLKAMNRFTKELGKLTTRTESLGKKLGRATGKLAKKSGKARQREANRTARDIERSAIYIEDRLDMLNSLVRQVSINNRGLIRSSELESEEDVQSLRNFRSTLESGRTTTAETLQLVSGYRDSVKSVELADLSRTIRIASRRLGSALEGNIAMLRECEKGYRDIAREVDKKLQAHTSHVED